MATRVNIDQRPRLMQFAGGALLMTAVLYSAQSFMHANAGLFGTARARVLQQRGEFNNAQYLGQCVQSGACREAYVTTWFHNTTPLRMACYVTGFLWGGTLLLVGSAWKPEMAMNRATRMRSWAQFNLPEKSAAEPGGWR